MSDPKISVIVPVYKVEPYLRKCLDSIVNQTYRNLEIILVDDGSPDSCGVICDEYAARDERIKVIHKANGGVASARNAGLDAATGDYIGWVDSDDWIEADMYEYLLKNALEQDADVAVCSRTERYPDRDVFWGWDSPQLWNRERALGYLLEDKELRSYLCDKLWRRELFADIEFPEGQIYEDIVITCRLILKAERVIALPESKYNYRQRADSIVWTKTLAQAMDYFCAAKRRKEELEKDWPEYTPQLEEQCMMGCRNIWSSYYKAEKAERKALKKGLEESAAFAKAHWRVPLERGELGITGRIITRLTPHPRWWAFALAGLASSLYELKHGRPL